MTTIVVFRDCRVWSIREGLGSPSGPYGCAAIGCTSKGGRVGNGSADLPI